jgi:hypothetical protein
MKTYGPRSMAQVAEDLSERLGSPITMANVYALLRREPTLDPRKGKWERTEWTESRLKKLAKAMERSHRK